jgi:hypothetical protein
MERVETIVWREMELLKAIRIISRYSAVAAAAAAAAAEAIKSGHISMSNNRNAGSTHRGCS